jgi:hypothetical protein
VLPGCRGELRGPHPGLDPRRLGAGIHVDRSHPLGLDQDRVVERAEGRRAVSRALRGHLQAAVTTEADDLGHVVGALDEGDRPRLEVGDEVLAPAHLVPVGIAGGRHPPRD